MPWDQWARIKHVSLYFEEVRQVAVPVGLQAITVVGRVHQSAEPGAKSAINDCLVCLRLSRSCMQ